jgi:hypothetical protein
MTNWCRVFIAIAVSFTLASICVNADQARRPSPGPSLVPMQVSLTIGSATYEAKSQGSCTHAPIASIYNVVSEMWSVSHEGDGRSVQLTFWKPADGSTQMFSLSVAGKPNVTVSTVRGGQISGSGTVSLAPSGGKGGTFTIDAKAKSGEQIRGTIKCDAFTAAMAEGGN